MHTQVQKITLVLLLLVLLSKTNKQTNKQMV